MIAIAEEPVTKAAALFMLIELPRPHQPLSKMILMELETSKVIGIIKCEDIIEIFQWVPPMMPQPLKLQEKIQMNTKRENLVFHIDYIQS